MKKRPIVLCILDGYGLSERVDGNAVKLANTPNIDDLEMIYPTTRIKASGMPVGLPDGQMGNSEVGHLNIGAGRTVYQSLTLINKAAEDGSFYKRHKRRAKHPYQLRRWDVSKHYDYSYMERK